jgi:hypothetical protein
MAATVMSGCSMAYGDNSTTEPLVTANVEDSQQVLKTLRFAERIDLKKAALSLNDIYSVSADGVEVGEIRGQYIYLLGDTFSLFSEEGNLVASEGEDYRIITAEAKLFDYNNEPAGSIKENISWPLTNWSIYDTEENLVGNAQQNLSLSLDFTVKDFEGNPQYQINKNMFSMFGAELSIKRLSNEATVSAMDVVWLAAIANEITEAQDEKNSDN